jgi:predicted extracellular nuclease
LQISSFCPKGQKGISMLNSQKVLTAAVVAAAALSGAAVQSHAAVIINEVYGGGGTTNTTVSYSQDFIELYNTGSTAVDLTGYKIAYASATGSFNPTSSSLSQVLGGSIAADDYYLIAGGSNGTDPGTPLPTPDSTSPLNMAASAGKVELLDTTGAVVDYVGYGSTANSFEGTGPAPTISITTSDSRTNFIDTNNNAADFTAGTPTPTASTKTPEPATLGLAAIGGALLITRRRNSK